MYFFSDWFIPTSHFPSPISSRPLPISFPLSLAFPSPSFFSFSSPSSTLHFHSPSSPFYPSPLHLFISDSNAEAEIFVIWCCLLIWLIFIIFHNMVVVTIHNIYDCSFSW
jgi:hypothetical protein